MCRNYKCFDFTKIQHFHAKESESVFRRTYGLKQNLINQSRVLWHQICQMHELTTRGCRSHIRYIRYGIYMRYIFSIALNLISSRTIYAIISLTKLEDFYSTAYLRF